VVSFYDVHLPSGDAAATAQANSLLCSAARLLPEKLLFTLPKPNYNPAQIVVPCFPSTVSIDLDIKNFPVVLPAVGEFAALESLFISGRIGNFVDLIYRCPKLRVIRVEAEDMHLKDRLVCGIGRPVHEFAALESVRINLELLNSFTNLGRSYRVLVNLRRDARPW
jgi:hypothetical protein